MNDRVTWSDGAYAGFWQRVAGRLIDWVIVGAVTIVLAVVLAIVFGLAVMATGTEPGTMPASGQEAGLVAVLSIALLLPDFLYDTLMTSRLGWTVGKRAVGVEVRRQDGSLLTFGQAVGRWFGRIVSSIPLNLGFLWAAWDPRKQTWHDKFVRCYVLKREYLLAPAAAPAQPAARPWGGQGGWGIPGAAPAEVRPSAPDPPAGGPEWPQAGAGEARTAPPADEPVAATPPPADEPAAPPAADEPAAPPAADEPTAPPATDEPPAATDWARELGWEADEPAPGPALEGDGIESARWTDEPEPGGGPERAVEPEQPRTNGQETPPARPSSTEPNVVAIGRAAIPAESAGWLQQVADQVDSRLDRVEPGWRSSPQLDAARACAFGLLLGHLATVYPHMEDDLDRVAEAHPSFSTLGTGGRLATLQQIAGDHARATAWLGPLIGTGDREHVRRLFD